MPSEQILPSDFGLRVSAFVRPFVMTILDDIVAQTGVQAILVGESLMRQTSIAAKVKELLGA